MYAKKWVGNYCGDVIMSRYPRSDVSSDYATS